MDFGLGSNALMGSSSDSLPGAPDSGTMERGSGSGLVRKRRSGLMGNDGRKLKTARTDDLGAAQSMLFQTQGPLLRSNSLLSNEQQQPSYSSPQTGTSLPSNDALALDRSYQNHALHARNAVGLGSRPSSLSCNPDEEEPWRCTRNDGKKWRCSKDAIAGHKFCKRHLNQGRHRSKKNVENAQSGSTAATTRTTPSSTTPVSGGSASTSVSEAQELTNTLEHAVDSSAMHISGISFPTTSSPGLLIANDGVPMVAEENSFKGSSLSESKLISSGSALNPQPINNLECGNIHSSLDSKDQDSEDPESLLLRQLIVEWNEDNCDRLDIIWPEADSSSHFKNL